MEFLCVQVHSGCCDSKSVKVNKLLSACPSVAQCFWRDVTVETDRDVWYVGGVDPVCRLRRVRKRREEGESCSLNFNFQIQLLCLIQGAVLLSFSFLLYLHQEFENLLFCFLFLLQFLQFFRKYNFKNLQT